MTEPSLEILNRESEIVVQQNVKVVEIVINYDAKNFYTLYNSTGQPLMGVREESKFWARLCLGKARPLKFIFYGQNKEPIFSLKRRLKCKCLPCCGGIPCCSEEVVVYDSQREMLGRVIQEFSCLSPHFSILSREGDQLYSIEGPICPIQLFSKKDLVFPITDLNNETAAEISKKWSGFFNEYFTTADVFGLRFLREIPILHKQLMLSAVFLIDLMYFENKNN